MQQVQLSIGMRQGRQVASNMGISESPYTGYLGAAGNSSSIGSGENDENRPEALTSMRVVVPHG